MTPQERVAEAICGASTAGKLFPWAELDERERDAWRVMAQAAICSLDLNRSESALAPSDYPQAVYPETVGHADRSYAELTEVWPFPAMRPSDVVVVRRVVGPWIEDGGEE